MHLGQMQRLGGIAPLHDGAGTYISWDELKEEITSCGSNSC